MRYPQQHGIERSDSAHGQTSVATVDTVTIIETQVKKLDNAAVDQMMKHASWLLNH